MERPQGDAAGMPRVVVPALGLEIEDLSTIHRIHRSSDHRTRAPSGSSSPMIVSSLYAYSIMLPGRGPVLRGLTLDWCVLFIIRSILTDPSCHRSYPCRGTGLLSCSHGLREKRVLVIEGRCDRKRKSIASGRGTRWDGRQILIERGFLAYRILIKRCHFHLLLLTFFVMPIVPKS